jgi:hypothetical protein
MKTASPFGALPRWVRLHAPPLLRRLDVNVRRSLSKREVVVHGACLLLLLVLVAFDVRSIIATALVLGILWALGLDQRHAAHPLETDGKGADDALERRLVSTGNVRNEEEEPWKLGS